MNPIISPWEFDAECTSPDGASVARFEGMEIAMGAPAIGTLVLEEDGKTITLSDSAGPSMVWSLDGGQLAFVEWKPDNLQQLCVYSLSEKKTWRHTEMFRVIALASFDNGIIKGVDSPIHETKSFEVAVQAD